MVVVDTSFLIALHVRSDKFHRAALEAPLHGDRFLVPWEIWTEYCAFIAPRMDATAARRMLRSVRDGPFQIERVVDPDESERIVAGAARARDALLRMGHRPLTFYDQVVGSVASRLREGVLTFDRGLVAAVKAGLFPGARLAKGVPVA